MQYKTNKAIILLTGSVNLPLKKEGQRNLGRKQPALFDRGRLFFVISSSFIF